MNRRFPRLVLFLILVCLSFAAQADVKIRPGDKTSDTTKDILKARKKNGYPPPEPIDRTFNFTAGLSVDIKLEVATSFMGVVRFSIRDQPQFGKLSAIRPDPNESNHAIVTYTHGDNPNGLADKFTFQARIGESVTSAPGTITLIGKLAEPRLEVLEISRFKRLQPGESDSCRVVVTNTGTAAFSSDVTWPKPFIGPPKLEVAVNEKQTFILMLTAPATGAYKVNQELQPGVPASKVHVLVECVQQYSVSPGALTLAFDPVKGNRSGKIKISNGSTAPLTLQLECAERLKFPAEITLEPQTDQEVNIELEGDDVALFHGELRVVQDPHREKVFVHAEPEPAQMRLADARQTTIDFGKVEKGKKSEITVNLVNEGGEDAIVNFTNSPPFKLAAKSDNLAVPAGKTLPLILSFTPDQPGTFAGSLTINGNAGRIVIAVRGVLFDPRRPVTTSPAIENPHTPARPGTAEAAKPRESSVRPRVVATPPPVTPSSLSKPPAPEPQAPPAAPAPAPDSATSVAGNGDAPKNSPLRAMEQMDPQSAAMYGRLATFGFGLESLPEFKSRILDPVPEIGVAEAGRDYLVLKWATPKVEPKEYLIQSSRLVQNTATGLPMKSWKNVEGWKPVTVPAGVAAARIEGLNPDTEYELRVLGVDHEGRLSPSSDLLRVFTQPPFSLPFWFWMLLLASIVGIATLVVRRVREQRAYA